jgi:hypothetical protein
MRGLLVGLAGSLALLPLAGCMALQQTAGGRGDAALIVLARASPRLLPARGRWLQ